MYSIINTVLQIQTDKMIPIAKPILGKREKDLVLEVLSSGTIAQGSKVKEFEDKFAKYTGTKHAVATSNGTTALHMALLAHGIGKGDEVITTPFTFIASANSILYCNAKPVYADIEESSYNIDPEKVKEKIRKKTKAIMPVHLYGNPADMKALMEIAEDNKLAVIEDACQAHGAQYNGKKVGSYGTGAFSFYPTKNMTTGEGGMVTTDDGSIAERLRMLREHGSKVRYNHEILGYNYRMTDIAAAIGIAQLERLDGFNEARISNADYLSRKLKGIDGLTTPRLNKGVKHVFHQYTIKINGTFPVDRDKLAEILKDAGIGTGIHYPVPVHKQPLYKKLGYKDNLPVAEKVTKQVLSLPIHPSLTTKDLNHIANTIKEVAEKR